MSGEHGQRPSHAEGRYMRDSPRVVSLLSPCRPSTIAGLIVAAVVYAIQRVLGRRPWAHVFKKRLERLPLSADRYAATSVSGIPRSISRITTFPHPTPHEIFGRGAAPGSVHAVARVSMHQLRGRRSLTLQASTTPGSLLSEAGSRDKRDVATVATAFPTDVATAISRTPTHHQSTESLAREVNQAHKYNCLTCGCAQ